MSEMFYEENNNIRRPARAGKSSKMAQWLMAKGIAKTESAASLVLLGIAVVAIILTILVAKGDDIKRSFKSTPEVQNQQIDFQERRAERFNQ